MNSAEEKNIQATLSANGNSNSNELLMNASRFSSLKEEDRIGTTAEFVLDYLGLESEYYQQIKNNNATGAGASGSKSPKKGGTVLLILQVNILLPSGHFN